MVILIRIFLITVKRGFRHIKITVLFLNLILLMLPPTGSLKMLLIGRNGMEILVTYY